MDPSNVRPPFKPRRNLGVTEVLKILTPISLQVITEFCKSIGADAKQRQGLIRLAKKNGEKLGFLA